jgi:hypothetical protein
METKRIIQIISETESWFFVKINKNDKPLAKLTRRGRRPKFIKLEMRKRISQQIPMKFGGSFRILQKVIF